MMQHCYKCAKWRDDPDAKTQCDIFLRTMFYKIEEKKYPKQWRYVDGMPTCTAFVDRDKANADRRRHRKHVCKTRADEKTLDLFD